MSSRAASTEEDNVLERHRIHIKIMEDNRRLLCSQQVHNNYPNILRTCQYFKLISNEDMDIILSNANHPASAEKMNKLLDVVVTKDNFFDTFCSILKELSMSRISDYLQAQLTRHLSKHETARPASSTAGEAVTQLFPLVDTLRGKIEEFSTALQRDTTEKASLVASVEMLSKRTEELTFENGDLHKTIEELQLSRVLLDREKELACQQKLVAESRVALLEGTEDEFLELKEQLEERHAEMKAKQAELQKLQDESTRLVAEKLQLKTALDDMKRKEEALQSQIAEVVLANETTQKSLDELKARQVEIEHALDSALEAQKLQLEIASVVQSENDQLQSEIRALREEKERIQEELKRLEAVEVDSKQRIAEMQLELEELRKQAQELAATKSTSESRFRKFARIRLPQVEMKEIFDRDTTADSSGLDEVEMKPLLEVTNQEDRLNAKDEELTKIRDHLAKQEVEFHDLERRFQQVEEQRAAIQEQLEAEAEAHAEADEARTSLLTDKQELENHLQELEARLVEEKDRVAKANEEKKALQLNIRGLEKQLEEEEATHQKLQLYNVKAKERFKKLEDSSAVNQETMKKSPAFGLRHFGILVVLVAVCCMKLAEEHALLQQTAAERDAEAHEARDRETKTDDKVEFFVAGGWGKDGKKLKTIDIFDVQSTRWREGNFQLLDPPRSLFTAARLNGRIYFFGGIDDKANILSRVDIFDISTSKWIESSIEMPMKLYASIAITFENRIILFGGMKEYSSMSDIFSFNPLSTTIFSNEYRLVCLSSMNTSRSSFSVAFLHGQFYAIGGTSSGYYRDALDSVEKYNPKVDRWTAVTSMEMRRYRHITAVIDEIIFVIGGINEKGDILKSGELFSPSSSTWSPIRDMPTPREDAASFVHKGLIHVVGGRKGSSSSNILSSMDIYDPSSNSWKTSPLETPTARASAAFGLM